MSTSPVVTNDLPLWGEDYRDEINNVLTLGRERNLPLLACYGEHPKTKGFIDEEPASYQLAKKSIGAWSHINSFDDQYFIEKRKKYNKLWIAYRSLDAIVLDEDEPGGIRRLQEEMGIKLPLTFIVKTRKGFHFRYRVPTGLNIGNNNCLHKIAKMDIRGGDKGYHIICSPVHKIFCNSDPVMAPPELLELIQNLSTQSKEPIKDDHVYEVQAPVPESKHEPYLEKVLESSAYELRSMQEGSRNNFLLERSATLASIAAATGTTGIYEEHCRSVMCAAADAAGCDISDHEAFENGWQRGLNNDDDVARYQAKITKKTTPRPCSQWNMVNVEDLHFEGVDWLWKGRLQAGVINLIQGEPEAGKTTFLKDICCRLTRGDTLPFSNEEYEPMNVAWIDFDNDANHVAAHVKAMGAAPGRFFVLNKGRDEQGLYHQLRAPEDEIYDIGQLVDDYQIRVLVIDGSARWFSHTDMNNNSQVYALMENFKRLAEDQNLAVVMIRHTKKSAKNGRAIDAGIGAQAITGCARVKTTVGRFQGARAVGTTVTYSETPSLISFEFSTAVHDGHDFAVVNYLGEHEGHPDQLLEVPVAAKKTQLEACCEALTAMLEVYGELPGGDVDTKLKSQGFGTNTIKKAKQEVCDPDMLKTSKGKPQICHLKMNLEDIPV